MAQVGGVTYSSYLRLPELLSIQRPIGGGSRRVDCAEHFFIVTHQATELWLRQALIDIEAATEALAPSRLDLELALEHLERVDRIAQLLVEHVVMLGTLPVSCFAEFRPALGTASAAESAQFHALERAIGLRGRSSIYKAFLAAVEASGLTVDQVYQEDLRAGRLYRIAETLLEIAQRMWRWQVVHVELVSRLLGERAGTGGTSGVGYLLSRLNVAFPELWEARSTVHDNAEQAAAEVAARSTA